MAATIHRTWCCAPTATSFTEYTRLRGSVAPESMAGYKAPGTAVGRPVRRSRRPRPPGRRACDPAGSSAAVRGFDRQRSPHLRPASHLGRGRQLVRQGRLAVIANVGTLIVPINKASIRPTWFPTRRHCFRTTTSSRPGRRSVPRARGRLGGPFRRPAREHQREHHLHQRLGLRQRRVPVRRDRLPYQVSTGGATPITSLSRTLFGSASAASTSRASSRRHQQLFAAEYGAIVKRSIAAAGDRPTALHGLDVAAPTASVQPSPTSRPMACAAAPDGGADRRDQHAGCEAADVLRLDGRLGHPRFPERRAGRPAGADVACLGYFDGALANRWVDLRANVTTLHRLGLRSELDQQRRRHRPRLGRSPLHHRRRG